MENEEFEKIWRLLSSLFPNAAAKKSNVDKAVWRKGLSHYSMADVSDRVMEYARQKKYFPDLADITSGLKTSEEQSAEIEAATIHNAKLLASILKIDAPDAATADEAMKWYRSLSIEKIMLGGRT